MATNRFENCYFYYTLIGTRSECDRLPCEGQHKPVFNLYYHKINKETCYCLNRHHIFDNVLLMIEIRFVQDVMKNIMFAN